MIIQNIKRKAEEIKQAKQNILLQRINDHCIRLTVNRDALMEWHMHIESDEFFLVLEGELIVEFAGGHIVRLKAFDTIKIPQGVVHRTYSEVRTVNFTFGKTENSTRFVSPEEGSEQFPDIMAPVNVRKLYEQAGEKHINHIIWQVNDHNVRLVCNPQDYQKHYHPDGDQAFVVLKNNILFKLNSGQALRLYDMDFFVIKDRALHESESANGTGILLFEHNQLQTQFSA